MAIVDRVKDMPCLSIRGKHCRPGGLGDVVLGLSKLGEYDEKNGIYQMRYRLVEGVPYTLNKKSPKIAVKMRYYWPGNFDDPGQIAARTKFQNAIIAWKAESPEVKAEWNMRAKRMNRVGYFYYIQTYMLDRPMSP